MMAKLTFISKRYFVKFCLAIVISGQDIFLIFIIIQEHAKPIREALTYYLCTHEDNQFLLPAIRDIAEQHVCI
jgi:hypothetical protein